MAQSFSRIRRRWISAMIKTATKKMSEMAAAYPISCCSYPYLTA